MPHLLRYGTAGDQKFLLQEGRDTYDQLVLNGSIVAHMSSAMGVFVSQKARKPYLIDPQTHAFQHSATFFQTDSGEVKRSLQLLADEYGQPIQQCTENERALSPEDFDARGVLPAFCEKVLDFQRTVIPSQISESPDAKFFSFYAAKKGLAAMTHEPSVLIAPYFYLSAKTWQYWLRINLQCCREALKIGKHGKIPIASQIVISKELLTDARALAELVGQYTREEVRPNVFLIWVDSLVEQEASQAELSAYYSFIGQLGRTAPTVVLYGGFLSIYLSRSGLVPNLVAACHSLEYGESRAVAPVGGGIPISKFYVPALHMRTHFRDAVRAVRAVGGFGSKQHFFSAVCECSECRSVIQDDAEADFGKYGQTYPVPVKRGGELTYLQYPTPESKAHCVRHYLQCKGREFSKVELPEQQAKRLEATMSELGPTLGLELVAHLRVWASIIRSLADGKR